jgi:hypothetical protein
MDGQSAISEFRDVCFEMASSPFPKMVMERSRARPANIPTPYSHPSAKWPKHSQRPVPRIGSTNPGGRRGNGYFPGPGPFPEYHRAPCLPISYDRRNGREHVAEPFCKRGNAVLKRAWPSHRMARASAAGPFHISAITCFIPHP